MRPIIWDDCRRSDGSIALLKAASHTGCFFAPMAWHYLEMVERIMPISSRQAAAIAIANALEISARTTAALEK